MKIMIAYPPLISEKGVPLLSQNRQFQWFNSPTYIYPMVPAYGATMLKRAGYSVVWADGIAEEMSENEYLDLIKKEKPDLVMIESKTPVIKRHWKFINEVKKLSTNNYQLTTILVGDHVTALPEESMRNSPVDYILTGGDYDFLLLNLCNHLTKGEKLEPGIWYRKMQNAECRMQNKKLKNKIHHSSFIIQNYKNTGHFILNHDLNRLPMIDRNLTHWKLYAYKNGNYRYTPGTYTMVARDCWWGKCTFCSWTTLYPKYRTQKPTKLLDEIGNLINKCHVREIMDDSGTFPVGKWLTEFCQGMIERGYNKKVKLDCNMRFGILKKKDWELMARAGFRFILFGLESANQKTLDRINKNIKVSDIETGLREAKAAGLEPHITTMVGYPWESKEDAQKSIDLSRQMFERGYVDTLQATIVIPYPGTPLYRYCAKNNLLRFSDWDRFDQREQVMKSPLTTKDAKGLTQKLYRSFLTPRYILRKIASIHSWQDFKFLARAGIKVLGHLTDFGNKKDCECKKK